MKRIITLTALLFGISILSSAQDFTGKKVPAEFTVELDFASGSSPFSTAYVPGNRQTAEGEVYAYAFGSGAKQCTLNFLICQGPNGNVYSFPSSKQHFLDFARPKEQPDNCAYIKLPAVPGRYLKTIEVTIATQNATLYVCDAPAKTVKGDGLVAKFPVESHGTAAHTFAYPETKLGTAYYLYRSGSSAFRISNLKLTYASAKKSKR